MRMRLSSTCFEAACVHCQASSTHCQASCQHCQESSIHCQESCQRCEVSSTHCQASCQCCEVSSMHCQASSTHCEAALQHRDVLSICTQFPWMLMEVCPKSPERLCVDEQTVSVPLQFLSQWFRPVSYLIIGLDQFIGLDLLRNRTIRLIICKYKMILINSQIICWKIE